jgi:hypothetical protein
MSRLIDMSGQRIGKLLVLSYAGSKFRRPRRQGELLLPMRLRKRNYRDRRTPARWPHKELRASKL